MPINFNVDPYYDDFDQTKNFHRILFKPGRAVQARELTQSQTILQDQITKFADNIFKQNSPVTGGQVTTNLNVFYIKLEKEFDGLPIDVTNFNNLLIKNADASVVAQVVAVEANAADDSYPNTLIVSYKTGQQFADGDTIYDVNSALSAQAITKDATGPSSVVSIDNGVFYILGCFVQITASTAILDKYSNTPTKRVGLNITETTYDYVDDASLLDPAVGASNFQAPGADRYVIGLSLDVRPIAFGDDQNFVELARVVDGSIQKLVDGSVYNVIDDYFAKRDYETNGDYIVNDFKLTPRTNPDDVVGDTANATYIMSVGKGLAYVHGYRVANEVQQDLVSNRARTTKTHNNQQIFVDYGSYFYVDNVRAANGAFFDVSSAQTIDLHCVDVNSVNTASATIYNSTKVGTGYIRNLDYVTASNTQVGNTFVYKAHVHDIQLNSLTANAVSGTTNTITLPSTFSSSNSAYVGVNINIVQGTSSGDFRTITAYNGLTKAATVNQAWTYTPQSDSVFNLAFDIADTETILNHNADTGVVYGTAKINVLSKEGNLSSGDTTLQNANRPEMIFNVGAPYIKTITDSSYVTNHFWRNVAFNSSGGSVTAQLNYEGATEGVFYHYGGVPLSNQTADVVQQNFTVIVTDPGSNAGMVAGDIINWTSSGRTLYLDDDISKATFTSTDILYSFTADVISKTAVSNANDTGYVLKYKNLITANTAQVYTSGTTVNTYTHVDNRGLSSIGQVYIQNAGLQLNGVAQSLYLSDVKRIVKILDTVTTTTPSTGSLGSYVDVTSNYTFDNGQRDSYYDHATITLKTGAPRPQGNLLVYVDYYYHTGGDGYFTTQSYTNSSKPEDYAQIPSYTSKHGTYYSLRDSLDFRPVRSNATAAFAYHNNNNSLDYAGPNIPVDLSGFTTDYDYYLGRKDKLVLTKDRSFQIIEGTPALSPLQPAEPDGSLLVANITHLPYTATIPTEVTSSVSSLSIEKVKHKRYTMQDIAAIEDRINNIEYYTSLNLLEQKASSLQISDAYGLNRFKNGIMVDDFSSFAVADTYNDDYSASINGRDRVMSATQNILNFPLKSTALLGARGALSPTAALTMGYNISTDNNVNYFSLPYTTANVASQKYASRTVNVNPFAVSNKEGIVSLSPNVDNWVDTQYEPALLVVDPNLQVWQQGETNNVMKYGDWKAIPGTQSSKVIASSHNWYLTAYYSDFTRTNIVGPYNNIGNTYSINNGYITDVSILPYIRAQQILVSAGSMLFNTPVDVYFDGQNVNKYTHRTNVIELTGVSGGEFEQNDIIGYVSGGSFHMTGIVAGVYKKSSTAVRLYVAGDPFTTTYNNGLSLTKGYYDENGTFYSSGVTGTVSSTIHFGGRVQSVANTTSIKLSPLAPSANGFYGNGTTSSNTLYINAGTGAGQSSTIIAYDGVSKNLTLETPITCEADDVYSIGQFKTDETGSVYGIFNLPENTFHNGQRTLRIDNSNGNPGTETTFAEGSFYAEGLQTTSQSLDFGASPAGAKYTFTGTQSTGVIQYKTYLTIWDPVAQSFIIDKVNYPNGLFLDSATFFFNTKPTSDDSPITLSIVGTLNGYPSGQTLDHSVVTLNPIDVKTSTSPHYLDKNAATTFKFSAPVYIQPGVLYAFVLKSNSKEYTMWTASNGDTALKSSTKNLPSDPTPSATTKISSAPYVGGLFISQNSQTWQADQNQSMMFVMDRCVFDTQPATIEYVVPKKLPQRTIVNDVLAYFTDANTISSQTNAITNSDVSVDAFNITTTDFLPTTTAISYSYNATLASNGNAAGRNSVTPGKYGTPTIDDLYLTDGKGERILLANSDISFVLDAQISTTDNAVSPIISDAGLSTYVIQWNINNCELSNNLITVTNGGSSYSVSNTLVTFSAPTGTLNPSQAYGVANVVNGVIDAIYVTNPGSGYIETPTVTITTSAGAAAGATASIAGETSSSGGNALTRYLSKKVTLDQGFDSGDLNVFLSAYRPVNTDILVYYKILSRNDTQRFEDSEWQLMTKTKNSDSKYSQSRSDLIEYTFAPGTSGVDQGYVSYTSLTGQTYTSFNQFAIKIVFITSDNTFVPFATDMRTIALPANVNTTF